MSRTSRLKSGGRLASTTPVSGVRAPRCSASGPLWKPISSSPQSSNASATTSTSIGASSTTVSCGSWTTSDGGRSTVGTISTAGRGRLGWPLELRNSIVASRGPSTVTFVSHASLASRTAATSPTGVSTGTSTVSLPRLSQPGRSRATRPRSTRNVTPPAALPAISAAGPASGASSRVQSFEAGSGPAVSRLTGLAGSVVASPQTTSSRLPSASSSIARARGGSAGSTLACTNRAFESRPSCGIASGSSRVRIAAGPVPWSTVKARRPPAAEAVVHRQGVAATASRGRSSSNQTRSSTRSTVRCSSDRSSSFAPPSATSPDTVARNSTVDS